MAKLSVNDSSLAAIADAVRERKESRSLMRFPDGFVSQIRTIGGQPEREVNFRDYDGIVIFSYTIADFLELTELPINPEHDGLISQGWNWTLAGAQDYVRETGRKLEIGQLYRTEDGSTRLYITVIDSTRPVEIGFGSEVADGIQIDWGDGGTGQSTATAYTKYEHAYAQPGDYVISLTVQNGMIHFRGNYNIQVMTEEPYGVMGDNPLNKNRLTRIELGAAVEINAGSPFARCGLLKVITVPRDITGMSNAFYDCNGLTYLVTPPGDGSSACSRCRSLKWFACGEPSSGVGRIVARQYYNCAVMETLFIPASYNYIGDYAFDGCGSLKELVMPQDTSFAYNAFGRYVFEECETLERIVLNPTIASIGAGTFSRCYSLTNITIPQSVSSIENSAFLFCTNMKEYHFLRETPPTLGDNVFTGIPDDCVMYVPRGSLSAYQAAENWSEYASYMQEEPEV